jgi:uncharacterized protein (DUF1499 family)
VPECPGSPNCTLCSRIFTLQPDILFQITLNAVQADKPKSITSDVDQLSINAVYRIPLFGFMDDVTIALKPLAPNKTALTVRSASRIGHSDLGVNRRRISRILRKIENRLN